MIGDIMNRNGFTLVEIIATIAILSLLSLLIMPNIMKNYNQSKIDAITIQKNKLVEAGDIFLDDYCKDAINSSYKEKCEIYYQSLDSTLSSQLSDEKDYKYICVDDIKKLEYYTEDLKFGGTLCHGVVVYEIDKYTKMQSDSFSYVECGKEYPIEKTEY
jgi:prepilin-type N-terminal cleavage/methylation domain-containing protein